MRILSPDRNLAPRPFNYRSMAALRSLYRKFSTQTILLSNTRKSRWRVRSQPRVTNRRPVLEEDAQDIENMESEELDFMNIDRAYDEHFVEMKKQKSNLRKIITAKRFFSSRAEPLTLTHNEISCIKYLHQQDPVQWDAKNLSESFPATEVAIKRVLRSKLKLDEERIKIRDAVVQKNWALLEEGKLDADEHVLEHLKKFVNRREILLEQLKNADFFLPEVKEEPCYNNGEMNRIVAQYEKSVKKLTQTNSIEEVSNDEKLGLKYLDKPISESNSGKESFILGEMIKAYNQEELTLEELQKNILQKSDGRKYLDEKEKAILKSQLGAVSDSKENLINNKNVEGIEIEKSFSQGIINKSEKPRRGRSKKFLEKESTIEIESITGETSDWERKEMKENRTFVPFTDANTQFIKASDVGKILNKCTQEGVESSGVNDEVISENVEAVDPVRREREEIYYTKEVEDIKETPFWNSHNKSKEKVLIERRKAPLNSPTGLDQVTKPDVSIPVTYPEKINIPKDKRGSGLTFKVNDCYYDDDGEFLYRVPGMMK